MTDTPLNQDALEAARNMFVFMCADGFTPKDEDLVRGIVSAYLSVAQPEVNSVEELAQLPIGSAVLSEKYIAQQEAEEYPCVFQKLYTGDWHRGGRSSDTHPDYFLPARVLYRPEVNDGR